MVLALPDMIAAVDVPGDETPARGGDRVRSFLLGTVGVLPLIGRIADLPRQAPCSPRHSPCSRFRSLITAASRTLTTIVIGGVLGSAQQQQAGAGHNGLEFAAL